jgi:hypothetical protein
VLQLINKSGRSLSKTHSALKSKKSSGGDKLLFNKYLQKKEEVMKERAKRLIELNNMNISNKIKT